MGPRKVSFWSLDHPVPHSRKTLGPCLVLPWDSFTAGVSAMGFHLVTEVSLAQGVASGARPKGLDIYKLEGNASVVAAVPVDSVNRKNLPLSWVNQGTRVNVNLKKLLSIHPFEVPRGSSAQIPLTQEEFADVGTCLVIHFDKAEFVPVEEGRRKGKNGQTQAAAAAKQSPGATQPQAPAAQSQAPATQSQAPAAQSQAPGTEPARSD